MNKLMASDAATSLVLKPWTERCCAAPVQTVHGTGLPFGTYEGDPAGRTFDGTGPSVAGIDARVDVLVTDGMGADQVQTVRIPTAMTGIPPRRTPSRC
ncbi:MAG TPA: hypothetical protein VI357_12215 [Mycobacteriales bacterium]